MKPLIGGKLSLYISFTILFFFACRPEIVEQIVDPTYPGVDERLWEYFEDFEEEGRNRGYNIDIRARGITAEFQEIDQEHVAGICNFNFRSPNHIIIDEEFWRDFPQRSFREMIIFHELGHCYLEQDHREGVLDRNICASIMRSGSEGCFDNYNNTTRSFYLDELFDFSQ